MCSHLPHPYIEISLQDDGHLEMHEEEEDDDDTSKKMCNLT